MARTELMDPREAAEAEALFSRPPENLGTLVPAGGATNITVSNQIITAQKVAVPRDDAKILQKIKTLAAIAGEDWYYSFPVKKKGGGTDQIEGPSIKCAMNVWRIYGNSEVDCRAVDQGTSWMFYAKFVDYESGSAITRPFSADKAKTSINTKDPGRQQEIAFSIATSKATRNVICKALDIYTDFAFEEAKKNLVEKVGKQLDHYRQRVIERLAEIKVDVKRVETMLGRVAKDWLARDVARVIAELKAVADGMALIDDVWPPLAPPEPKRGDFKKADDQGAGAADAKDASDPPADAEKKDEPTPSEKKDAPATGAAATSDQPKDAVPAINEADWKIDESLMGLERKVEDFAKKVAAASNSAEIDAVERVNGEFIDKLGSAYRKRTDDALKRRREALAK